MKLCLARSSPLGRFRVRDASLARRDGCICRLITKHMAYLCERKKWFKKSPYLGLKKFSIRLACTKEREPRPWSPMSRESMTVWDSRFHAVTDFRIPGTRFQSLSLELGFWVLIVSGFLKLYSRLQSPGFRISQVKFSGFRIPRVKIFRIPESGFPFMGWRLLGSCIKGRGYWGEKKKSPSL